MEPSTEVKCFKYLVYTYIVLLSLSGGLQIFFGATFAWNHLSYSLIIGNHFWVPSTLLLCMGPVTYLMCWLGWNAVSQKNRSYLKLFTGLLVILVCTQFTLSAWSLAMREKLPGAAKFPIDSSYADFVKAKTSHLEDRHVWHKMQYELKCCGVYDLNDYFRTTGAVPWSCCSIPTDPGDSACKTFYQRGCLHILSDTIRERLFYVSIVLISAAIIQSMGLFCIIQLTALLSPKSKDTEMNEPSTSRATARNRRTKELLPLAQANKLADSEKY